MGFRVTEEASHVLADNCSANRKRVRQYEEWQEGPRAERQRGVQKKRPMGSTWT